MPTQDERLSTVEQSVAVLRKGMVDIHHNETVLLGVMAEQGKDIREMKVSLAVLNEHLVPLSRVRILALENKIKSLMIWADCFFRF